MPSEQCTPPPWERERKERNFDFERGASAFSGDALPGEGATTPRWSDRRYGSVPRDSPHPPPSGLNRIYPEDSPSQSDRPYTEDERKHGRDNRNPFRRSPTLNAPSNVPMRPLNDSSIITTTTRSLTVPVSTISTTQPSPKYHTDSRNLSLASLSWKPLKWVRTGSSVLPAKEERQLNVLVPAVKEASIASPVASSSVGDEMGTSRKKARLGWGQGLAKYEKTKVQGSVDSSGTRSGGPGEAGSSGVGDAGNCGPVIAASCPSPVTPLSATSRSSAIPAEKQSTTMASIDENTSHQNGADSDTSRQPKDLSMKLDFSVNSVGALSTLLADLLQPEDACTGDSTFMNKISMLKVDISKELEKTESEIDSLEFQLKSLDSETKPIVAHQDQAPPPAEKMSEPYLMVAKDCNKLVTEELVGCSEKQDVMLVDLKIEEGQKIGRCSEEPSTSKDDDDNIALGEAKGSSLVHLIVAANKDTAELASNSFGVVPNEVDIWEVVKGSCSRTTNLRIKEKLAVRKRQMKFKEQVLALKFMALKQLWKDDLRVLNTKNGFTKSGKRASLSSVPLQSSPQKPRSHVHSQLASVDDSSTIVPSTEILEYSSKLLSSFRIKQYRSYQKMPSLIIDSKEKESRQFPTRNGLIEDPVAFERDRAFINPWTSEEKEVFMEMLATFGKDFPKISSFLDHKTTADCVEFYYKNHKSESFAEVRKHLLMKKKESQLKLQQLAQSSTFLVATSRKWSRESNAAALDILGAASVVAAYSQTADLKGKQKVFSSKSRGNHCAVDRKVSMTAHVPSTIGRALSSSEAMSSCVTTSTDPAGKTSHVRQVAEEYACSEESCGDELVSADWTDEEKTLFVEAYNTHGKDFSKISHRLGTRSRDQCKVFFCKAQKSLGLDFSNHGEDNDAAGVTLPGNCDTNGGSDTDDGPAEMDSGICSTQSCSKASGDMAMTSEAVAEPENAIDGTIEQEVVGAVVNSEIYDCFSGKQETIIGEYTDLNEKPVHEEGKLGPEPVPNKSGNASLTCNEKESLPEIRKTINLDVMIDQSTAECAEAGSDPALHATGACSAYQSENSNERPVNMLKERVNSAHCVVLHQTGTARSRRCASIDLGATSSVISFASDPNANESLISKPAFGTGYLSQVPSNSQPVVLKDNNVNNWSVHFGSRPTSNPSGSICFSGHPHVVSQRTLNFEEHLSKPHHNVPETSSPLQQYVQKNNPLVNQMNQSSHVLKGYPLQMPSHNRIKNGTDIFSHVQGRNISQPNQFIGLASNTRYNPVTGISIAQKIDDKCDFSVPPTSQPVFSTENDAPCRTGDVKLFGKILTQPSSQKVCTRPPSPKPKPKPKESSSSTQKGPILSVPNGHSFSAPLFSMPVGASAVNRLGLDVIPVKSHGMWDRDSIRPGPSLPESARMMTKYHDSAGGALPFYPGKDSNNSNVHINLSNVQQAHMQQLTSNGGRVDGFSMTVPKRSGVDMVQQFAPNMVGAASGLIRAGGVVSDPVVAMKMHYASNATVCSSSSNGSGLEAWNDVGR